MKQFYFALQDRRRNRRMEWLNDKIERLTVLINGLDEDVWPDEYQRAAAERQRYAVERYNLAAVLHRPIHGGPA